MTFANILKAFKDKKKQTIAQKKRESETEWTFKNKKQKKVVLENNLLKKEIDEKLIFKSKKNVLEQNKITQQKQNDKKNLEKRKRISDNLMYLKLSLEDELQNMTLETLLDEFEFLRFKKYELKTIKENEEIIQKYKNIKKAIDELENVLIKRIERYNYFVEKFTKKRDNINAKSPIKKYLKVVTIGNLENDNPKIEYNKQKVEPKIKKEIEILNIGKYSNLGETIMKFLLKNKNNYTEGRMGWNKNLYDCVEDWSIERALGIVEEFRVNNPNIDIVNLTKDSAVVLDVSNKSDIKILSIEKNNASILDKKENNSLKDYEEFFGVLLESIFSNNIDYALKEQVLDIENANTKIQLSKEQILSFRELKYMIGEIIGERSISRNEDLKKYSKRVVGEIYKKCKVNKICNVKEKEVFDRIFRK